MSRYEKGTAGKIIVQDWDVLVTYPDSNVLRWLTPRQSAALISLCQFLHWRTRFANAPVQDDLDAFASETVYNLMTDVAFCALMVDCIVNDSDVIEALHNFLVDQITNNVDVKEALNQNYNPQSPNVPMPEDVSGQDILASNPGCDLDNLFGQVSSLIDAMNTNNVDSQEVIEALSNSAERVSALLEGIPILDELPIGDLISYAQDLWSNDIFENYAATDTTDYRNQLKCDLFCLAQANGCTLSLDEVAGYFAGRLGATPTDTVSDIVIYLLAGVWSGTEINDLFYLAQSIFMTLGNKFFNLIGLKPFEIYLALGEPSDDWMLLCDSCASPQILLFDSPINFGGTQYATYDFSDGVNTVFSAVNPTTGRYGVCLYAPDGDYTQEFFVSSGSTTAPGSEIVWLYTDLFDAVQLATGATEVASDFPTPIDVRMEVGSNLKCTWFWSASPFDVTVRLTRL